MEGEKMGIDSGAKTGLCHQWYELTRLVIAF